MRVNSGMHDMHKMALDPTQPGPTLAPEFSIATFSSLIVSSLTAVCVLNLRINHIANKKCNIFFTTSIEIKIYSFESLLYLL